MVKLNSGLNCVKLTIMTVVSPSLCLSLSLFSSGFLLLFFCLSSLPNIPAFFLFPALKPTVSFSCFSSTCEVSFVMSRLCVLYRMRIHRSCIKPQCEGCTVAWLINTLNIHSFHLNQMTVKWRFWQSGSKSLLRFTSLAWFQCWCHWIQTYRLDRPTVTPSSDRQMDPKGRRASKTAAMLHIKHVARGQLNMGFPCLLATLCSVDKQICTSDTHDW